MEQIVMKHADGTTYALTHRGRASAVTGAEQHKVLLGEDTATITVETAEPLPVEIGDTAEILGKTYTLNKLPQIRKTGNRRLQYTITMEGPQYKLIDVQFILSTAGMSDAYTGPLAGHMSELVACLNRRYGTAGQAHPWTYSIEEGIGAEYKTYDFGGKNCLEVLQTLCQDYKTEFEMTTEAGVTTIAIGTAGQVITSLGTFHYGRSGGLYELSRTNVDSSDIVTRLYVFGGTQNLPEHMPGTETPYPYKRLLITGATSRANSYIQDDAAIALYGIKENTENFDDEYPRLEEHNAITALGTGNHAEQYFRVSDFPFDVNSVMISGTTPTITMQTGKLAGYRFEMVSYDNSTKTFRVKPYEDENHMTVPSPSNAAFQFGLGDTFLIGDIIMPDELVTAAKERLTSRGQDSLNQRKHPKVSYSLQLDSIRLARQMSGQAGFVEVFHPGDYIPVEDSTLGIDGNIRITAISRDIMRPYAYKLTLGDGSVQATMLTRIITDMRKQEDIIRMNQLQDPTRRHNAWRTTQELMDMVFDADGYFTDHIRPKSIETQMLEVGARSQQLMLAGVAIEPNYEGNPAKMHMSAGTVTAYALEDGPRTWNMSAQTQTNLDPAKAYYVYIQANTAAGSTTATYLVTDAQHKAYDETADANHYYFLLGTLSSPKTDAQGATYRILSLTYGETTINGRYIRTGRIMDSTGGTFIDLDENKLRLGTEDHCIDFNNIEQNGFILKGVKLKSTSGDTNVLAVYRGVYSPYARYYFGDEVSYTADGETATYRCYDESTAGIIGITPTDSTKWVPVAKGKQGIPGEASSGIARMYEVYGNSSSASVQPQTWTESIPTYSASKPYLWNALAVLTTDAGATPTYHDIECLGYGISNVRERYARTNSSTAPPHATLADVESAPWQDGMPSLDPTYLWMWNLEIMEYMDGRTATFTSPSLISHYGKDGLGVQSMTEVYANSASETQAPQDSEWLNNIPAHSASKPYLWNALRITYEDSRGVQYTNKQCLGQGVRIVKEYYRTTTTATTPDTPSPSSMTGWSQTMPSVDNNNRWLWNVELLSYYDSRPDACTSPSCIAHYGGDGQTGRSITGVIEQYAIGTASAPTGQWVENIPQATQQNPYIWNREKITYDSGNPTYTAAQIMGKDINTITEQYAVSSDGTTAPTSGWGTYAQIASQLTKGKYLWNREIITYSNGYQSTTTEPACIGYQGKDGDNGSDAAEVQPNILMDANFNEGKANNIAEDQGWWTMNGTKTTGIDGKRAMSYDNTDGTTYVELLNQFLFKVGRVQPRIEPQQWYTLSFWAKGSQVDTYLYGMTGYQVVDTTAEAIVDGTGTQPQGDGHVAWTLDENSWTRHTYTFKTKNTVISDEYEKKVLFRIFQGQHATVCMPKLERGLHATAFCLNPEESSERATSYRGTWNAGETYTGTGSIRQCVKYGESFYMTLRTAGNFSGDDYSPDNALFWREFDAVFENVATGLLLAHEAVIENAIVRKLQTNDTTRKRIQITGNEMQVFDDSNNMKMRVSGETITGSGTAATANVETITQNTDYDRNFITLFDDRTLWSFNVTATNNVLTIPKLKVSLQFSSLYLQDAGATADLDLRIDNTIVQTFEVRWNVGDLTGGPSSFLTNWFTYTTNEIVRSMEVGNHTISLSTRVLMYSTRDNAGIQIRNKIEPYTEGAQYKLDYTDDVLEIGANGLKAIFGSALSIVQFTKDNGTLNIQLRSGNAGVEMANGSLLLIIAGVKYSVSTTTISGNMVPKLTAVT